MMGCQPQGLLRTVSHSDPRYSLASQTQPVETVSVRHPADTQQQHSTHSSPSIQRQDLTPSRSGSAQVYHSPSRSASATVQAYHFSSRSESAIVQSYHSSSRSGSAHTYHLPSRSESASVQAYRSSSRSGSAQAYHLPTFTEPVAQSAHLSQDSVARSQGREEPSIRHALDTVTSLHFTETGEAGQQQLAYSSATAQQPAYLSTKACDFAPSPFEGCSTQPYISLQSPPAKTGHLNVQQPLCQQYQQPENISPSQHQLSPIAYPPTMLDRKPVLQVLTTDQSPVSPASSTSSPRFVFPDVPSSSSLGCLASDSSGSPFRSLVKQEMKVEVDASESEATSRQQVSGERRRLLSGDTDPSDTLVDSETSSSVLEDSSSSREHSPFSAMAESLSLRSPSEHSHSPRLKKTFVQQSFMMASEEEVHGEGGEGEGGVALSTTLQPELDFHPSKFKKRLHERYVLSLKDTPGASFSVKEESSEKYKVKSTGVDIQSDSKRPISKVERPDSPKQGESSMPKSPRRSSSDTDMVHLDSSEIGASSADEGDVFMEPTIRARTKHRPPSLHQREPLDLSRGPFYPGFRSSSGSSPLVDPDHLSPASKLFSPVFRSPHRLPYSPHGLMSPQSQSPLCSVPEGGRIFNFNMPSPLEGPHSDSDLISPSPMSPRVFTFPPPGSMVNPMADVNRLAVSPRAPYTPPPTFMRNKPGATGGMLEPKWGDQQGFYSKRSLSESDVTYLCPVCGQVFPTNDNLAKHMNKHLPSETARAGDNNKVHYCKVCSRSFSRSDMLTRHMRLHTGLKPYECMDCGQVFSRSDHLNTHRRTHTGEKPYRCPHCPYAACRRDMITRHMRTHSKRTSRRTRYLSVPDDGETQKLSGSISSTDTVDSQDCSTGGHTCSVSSVDSVELESIHSPHPTHLGASVDSLLSPDMDLLSAGPHSSSPSSRKCSEDLEEEKAGQIGGLEYERFMQYRKARNWSATSLESVDSEEALFIKEALVDDAFQDPSDRSSSGFGGDSGDGGDDGSQGRKGVLPTSKDLASLETKTLQKCFISPQAPGSSNS